MNELDFSFYLNTNEINYLKKFASERIFNSEMTIIYKNQIPTAAYLILEGSIEITNKRKNFSQLLGQNHLIGLKEIYAHKKIKFNIDIKSGSKVLIIDHSTVLELLNKNRIENPISHLLADMAS